MLQILKYIPVFLGAVILGNWFMSELKKSRMKGEPWYKPYLTAPGILILLICFVVPVVLWLFRK